VEKKEKEREGFGSVRAQRRQHGKGSFGNNEKNISQNTNIKVLICMARKETLKKYYAGMERKDLTNN
jgi:hypothetical protein